MSIKLNGRERRLLELVRDGHTNKEIGEKLRYLGYLGSKKKNGIGPERVKDLLNDIANKLFPDGNRRRSRFHLVTTAISHQLIPCYCGRYFEHLVSDDETH